MEQEELLKFVLETLDRLNVAYMVVGSFASIAYGEPRFTQDIDVVIQIPVDQFKLFCDAFRMPEFYLSHEAAAAAIRQNGQFNVIHPTSGNKIDFIVPPANKWGREQLSRRRRLSFFAGCTGSVASPEDVIIGKMLYYREGGSEKHIRDITGMMKALGPTLDHEYVQKWAETFDLVEVWQAILSRLSG